MSCCEGRGCGQCNSPEKREINRIAWLLIREWERVERVPVNISYYATFADMARAVIVNSLPSKPISDWPGEMFVREKTVGEPGGSTAGLQWKGTDACLDIWCKCGARAHLDDEFVYFYKCAVCERVYAMGSTVRMYELTPEAAAKYAERAKSDRDCPR